MIYVASKVNIDAIGIREHSSIGMLCVILRDELHKLKHCD